ncbi:MAG: FMN-binding glutamate synthase family protein [Dehalococcoidia bacterium]
MSTGWLIFTIIGSAAVAGLALLVVYDLTQTKHAILRNFPIIGHFRYWLEFVGPELRQYIVTSNTEERPFNRDQRRWVYASAKKENNYFGYGSSEDMELTPNYLIIKHSAFPLTSPAVGQPGYDAQHRVPAAKILGGRRKRAKAFRPPSVVNISGMSFGSLSGNAVTALNEGTKLAGCLQSTGEGSLSPYHQRGGELIWQLGTGYFGARTPDGRFDLAKAKDVVAANPVRAIEVKLSQGAKPGLGGVLPAAKVTKEIAAIRGIPMGRDCISPAAHPEFHDVDTLLDFVEMLADATGLPVGIKSAVGAEDFWHELARKMATTGRGVDFITIDGGEGGTGAGPLVFSDHVALPFKVGFSRAYRAFAEQGIAEEVVFVGSGKLGFPESALLAFSLGCDMINVGREAMMAIGCIQAQRCHTDRCPTGVATQDKWLMRGLDPMDKAPRLANYVRTLRKELLSLSHACGVAHPALVTANHIEILDDHFTGVPAGHLFGYREGWGMPATAEQAEIARIMAELTATK